MQTQKSKFFIFDNFIVAAFMLFIGFAQALTIKVGFPLKISEISLFILLFLLAVSNKFRLPKERLFFQFLHAFIIVTFISLLINIFKKYPYELNEYDSRFGYTFDSVFKFFYLVLAYFALYLSIFVFKKDHNKYTNLLIKGAIFAALYSWFLAITSFLHLPTILLPGMDAEPQFIRLQFGDIIRAGTFKEGNFMGLFLIVSAVVAFYRNKKRSGFFLLISILTTFSSIAIISAILFLILYNFKNYFNYKHLYKIILFSGMIFLVFILSYQNSSFKELITNKFFGNTSEIGHSIGTYSKADRLNIAYVALNIGLNNPLVGIGFSNYARHYPHYNTHSLFNKDGTKSISNNIYLEVFSEIGGIALILFLSILFLLYKKASLDKSGSLKIGMIIICFYFLSFPTFTVLFLWVFWGLIISLPADKSAHLSHEE